MKLFDLLPADVKAQLYSVQSSHKLDHVPYPHAKRVHRVAGGLMPSLSYVEPDSNRGYDVPRPARGSLAGVCARGALYGRNVRKEKKIVASKCLTLRLNATSA